MIAGLADPYGVSVLIDKRDSSKFNAFYWLPDDDLPVLVREPTGRVADFDSRSDAEIFASRCLVAELSRRTFDTRIVNPTGANQ